METNNEKIPTILVVEDDWVSTQLLNAILKGNKLLFATSGMEAIDIFKKNSHIDIIIMDIKMDGMDGIEAVKNIRSFNTEVKIIVQTAIKTTQIKEDSINAGANDYLAKPIDSAALKDLILKHAN